MEDDLSQSVGKQESDEGGTLQFPCVLGVGRVLLPVNFAVGFCLCLLFQHIFTVGTDFIYLARHGICLQETASRRAREQAKGPDDVISVWMPFINSAKTY